MCFTTHQYNLEGLPNISSCNVYEAVKPCVLLGGKSLVIQEHQSKRKSSF